MSVGRGEALATRIDTSVSGLLVSLARTKLRKAIRAAYPRIPAADLEGVLRWSIPKRTGDILTYSRPGLTGMAIAVVRAYIRHRRTPYDEALMFVHAWSAAERRREAREAVEREVRTVEGDWS